MWSAIGGAGILLLHLVEQWFAKRAVVVKDQRLYPQYPQFGVVVWGKLVWNTGDYMRVQVGEDERGWPIYELRRLPDEEQLFLHVRLRFVKSWEAADYGNRWCWHHAIVGWQSHHAHRRLCGFFLLWEEDDRWTR